MKSRPRVIPGSTSPAKQPSEFLAARSTLMFGGGAPLGWANRRPTAKSRDPENTSQHETTLEAMGIMRSRATSSAAGWLALGVGSALAGLIAQRAGLPAGWLVGPMLVALAVALLWERHPTMPRWGRIASLAVVGGVLASAFRPSVVPLISRHWLPVALVGLRHLAPEPGGGALLSVLVRLDRKTAALGTLPGAASGMLAMSDPLGADARLVALMQYTRVVVVVVSATLVGRFGLVPGTESPPTGRACRRHRSWRPSRPEPLDDLRPNGPGCRARRLGRHAVQAARRGAARTARSRHCPRRARCHASRVATGCAAGSLPRPRPVGRAALRRRLREEGRKALARGARLGRGARGRVRRPRDGRSARLPVSTGSRPTWQRRRAE